MSLDSRSAKDAPTRQTVATTDWADRLAAACRSGVAVTTAQPEQDARRAMDTTGLRDAAVLIGVRDRAVPTVVLTQRSAALRHHPGQISFPGGAVESGDGSPAAAACREAFEEIGLAREAITVLGQLPRYITVTGFSITPIVGRIDGHAAMAPDGIEADAIIELPLSQALTPWAYAFRRIEKDGRSYRIYSIDHAGHHVWGATASMLVTLARSVAVVDERAFTIAEPAGDS